MTRWRLWLLVCCSLIGCAPKAYVRSGWVEHPPRRVAVLPFVITYTYDLEKDQSVPQAHLLGRDLFRRALAEALTPDSYQDIPLDDVDARLTQTWGPLEQGRWQQATAQELGRALNADAVIYGDLTRVMYFATPLYTETSLSASLRMVDTQSGNLLWSQSVQAAERGGAAVQKGQVVDFVQDQLRSYNPAVKFSRVSEAAARQALKGLPNPPLPALAVDELRLPVGSGVRLAVLPLTAKGRKLQQGAQMLRRELVVSLQHSPFRVIEPAMIDATLHAVPANASTAQLGQQLGADVMLSGRVTSWGRRYAVLESWAQAGLELELRDAASGQLIWSGHRTLYRQAGILKGPTGVQSIATAPIMGLKTSHLERVAGHVAQTIVDDMDHAPAVRAYVEQSQPAHPSSSSLSTTPSAESSGGSP